MDANKKLHNIIFVCDKIVTCKTAAAILNVNVNEAKTLLQKYVSDTKTKKDNLHISFVVGGITLNKTHKLVVVSESKYEKVKSDFSQITTDHIYSVQKSPLVEWASVFNVDDFLYDDKNNVPAETQIKKENTTAEPVAQSAETKTSKPQVHHKKGSISSIFSQCEIKNKTKPTNKEPPKKSDIKTEEKITTSKTNSSSAKQTKSSVLSNFVNKTKQDNKENISKTSNKTSAVKKEEIVVSDEDDDEIFVSKTKKRTRIINDDDDDEIPSNKCAKVDILDDPMETEEMSDVDIFGSPEKDEALHDTEETFSSDVAEKDTQSSVPSSVPENNMYEDDDGYFVTEKKPGPKKSVEVKTETKKSPKEIAQQKKIEKETKKEVNKKLKKDTNQKTLLNFFTKK